MYLSLSRTVNSKGHKLELGSGSIDIQCVEGNQEIPLPGAWDHWSSEPVRKPQVVLWFISVALGTVRLCTEGPFHVSWFSFNRNKLLKSHLITSK